MKTPSIDLNLGADYGYKTQADEDIVVKVPRSVSEGFVYELGLIGADDDKDDKKAQAESARDTMLAVLELVTSWNVDDEAGQPLPTIRSITEKDKDKQRESRVKVLAQIPIEVTKSIVDKVTASTRINPRVEGF